ncbi:DUF2189 domain-containing protein [Roseobacter sp. YSTF-M11]|uniref:DUF2189 domain-containing protein n=1 Tax=Roseobacter insulae TaxID=2859783 RepID=A0A9X1FTJ4_9RHOB|nr:DUF2189 domain-containing protein [Roseobacter insulae]MBW4707466.1 DUF2189 domain-containing protein [Roseobacter insulae]
MQTPENTLASSKARIVDAPIGGVVSRWLRCALRDFRTYPRLSVAYGLGLFIAGWVLLVALWRFGLGWMILPTLAGCMLVGPVVTIGLYRISRRAQGSGGRGVASPGQVLLAGTILMVFALTWLRAATLIFAVFFGLLPFTGLLETLITLLSTPRGIATVIFGTITGGLFAALGFAISVFSIPMLIDREVDCFTAMALSFNATTHNFGLMIVWAALITASVTLGVLTGLLGLIFIFPILGFATWHAYCDLFKG